VHAPIARTRLFDLVDSARDRRVVWIWGPPGAGKTALVVTYLQALRLPSVWYQIDSGDADPASFFFFLREAVHATAPRKRRLPLLTPEYQASPDGFARRFFREIFPILGRECLLIFDNYQELATQSQLHEILQAGFEEIPDGLNVVVISRQEPPAAFARTVVSEALAIIDWEQMRMTPEEVGVFADSRAKVDPATVRELYKMSNGWIGGVTLMLERLRRDGVLYNFSSGESAELLFDYFASQIFDAAPVETRELLMKTALLPSFSVKLAESISGHRNAGTVIEFLHRRRLFIDRLPGQEVCYQYHALFHAFLQHRAQAQFSFRELAEINARAAQLLLHTDNDEVVYGLYCQAGNWEDAVVLFAQMAPKLIGHGRWQTVAEFAARLPAPICVRNPWVGYWLATALVPMRTVAARDLFKKVFIQFQDNDVASGQMMAAAGILDTIYTEFVNFLEMQPWADVLAGFLENDPEFPSREAELRVYLAFVGTLYALPGHPLLGTCVRRLESLLDAPFDVNLKVVTGQRLLACADAMTDLDLFRRVVGLIDPLLSSPQVTPANAAQFQFMKGYDHYIAWNPGEALACFDRAMNIAQREGLAHLEFRIKVYIVYCARRAGKIEIAQSALDELSKSSYQPHGLLISIFEHAKALMAFTRGDLPAALRASSRATQSVAGCGYVYADVVLSSFYGQFLLAAGDLDAASRSLAHARALAAGTAIDTARAYIALTEGHVAHLRGELGRRDALIREALEFGKHTNGIARLRWDSRAMEVLLPVALKAGIEVSLVQSLIRTFGISPPSRSCENWPWPIKIYTFGRLELLHDGAPLVFGRKAPRKALALLAAIVAYGGKEVPESHLLDTFWPDADGDAAHHALTTLLHRLRKVLRDSEAILQRGAKLSLNPQRCWVDSVAFQQLINGNDPPDVDRALALYRGPFLALEADTWALPIRERLQTDFVRAIKLRADALEAEGAFESAIEYYTKGLEADPLVEAFYQGLMRCYSALHRRAEASTVYRRLQETLSRNLGIKPSLDSQRLFDAMTAQ
jgi:ATP/maltotriose-dependent transcriptional regulator MalT/DNA-binding SARP family transcriptional activator